MHEFPHQYRVNAELKGKEVAISSNGLPRVTAAAPVEFDGPGGHWSPETLLTAALANCFLLTFEVVAGMSKLAFQSIDCDVDGTLDRPDRQIRFTAATVTAHLTLAPGEDIEKADRLLHKSKDGCLISNSLGFPVTLVTDIRMGEPTSSSRTI